MVLDYLKIAPAVLAIEAAVAERSLPAIEDAAVKIANIAGIGTSAAEAVAVIENARKGDWAATLKAVEPLLEEAFDMAISRGLFGQAGESPAVDGAGCPVETVDLSAQLDALRDLRKAIKCVRSAA